MQCNRCFPHVIIEAIYKSNRARLAIAAGEIGSVVGMIADELRLLIYSDDEMTKPDRINVIDSLLEVLPSRFSHDPEAENEEWKVHGDGILQNGELTTLEVDWLLNVVNDVIEAAALVRESRFSDGEEFFMPLSNFNWHPDILLADRDLARARNPFVEFMETVPW